TFLRAKFFRGAEPRWFDETSLFRSRLSREITNSAIAAEIISFEWSGANSVFARSRAAESLRTMLLSRGQNRSVTIIAHSHGGNVALRAVGQDYSHADTMVITLATPFLQIYPTTEGP